jgi:hypothetical protein
MTLDDESLLTAYLDGELGPEERVAVELALVSDAELAERYRQITAIHEFVGGLAVPMLPADLAGPVVAAIERRSRSRRLGVAWPMGGRRAAAVMAGVGLAASLLVALGLALLAPRNGNQPGAPRAALTHSPKSVARGSQGARATFDETGPSIVKALASAPRPLDEGIVAHGDADARAIRAMLDNPRLRRVFYVTDIIGGALDTRDRVEELVQTTPRTEATYGRITVSQGIVIDPRHPNEAAVFVLVMNDQEVRRFQKRLELAFPQQVESVNAEPAVVTQLADIGQMTVLPGTPASEVIIPDDTTPRVALRTNRGQQRTAESTQIAKAFGLPDLPPVPGPEGPAIASRPAAPNRESPGAAAPLAAARASDPGLTKQVLEGSFARALNLHDPPSVVIVWVTTR